MLHNYSNRFSKIPVGEAKRATDATAYFHTSSEGVDALTKHTGIFVNGYTSTENSFTSHDILELTLSTSEVSAFLELRVIHFELFMVIHE